MPEILNQPNQTISTENETKCYALVEAERVNFKIRELVFQKRLTLNSIYMCSKLVPIFTDDVDGQDISCRYNYEANCPLIRKTQEAA